MNENKIELYAAYVGSAFLLLHLCCAVACLTKRGLAVSLAGQGDELRWRRKLWHLHRRGTSSPPQSTAPNVCSAAKNWGVDTLPTTAQAGLTGCLLWVLRILQIIDGKELLNERTSTENRYLKKVGIGHWTARTVHSALSCSVLIQ